MKNLGIVLGAHNCQNEQVNSLHVPAMKLIETGA